MNPINRSVRVELSTIYYSSNLRGLKESIYYITRTDYMKGYETIIYLRLLTNIYYADRSNSVVLLVTFPRNYY